MWPFGEEVRSQRNRKSESLRWRCVFSGLVTQKRVIWNDLSDWGGITQRWGEESNVARKHSSKWTIVRTGTSETFKQRENMLSLTLKNHCAALGRQVSHLAQVTISGFEFKPRIGICADSLEPGAWSLLQILCLCLSLPLPYSLSLSLSLSLKNKH